MININNDDLLDTRKNRGFVVVIGATRSTKVQYWDQGLYIGSLCGWWWWWMEGEFGNFFMCMS